MHPTSVMFSRHKMAVADNCEDQLMLFSATDEKRRKKASDCFSWIKLNSLLAL